MASALGETVAAFAAHIEEAASAFLAKRGSARMAASQTAASAPANPSVLNQPMFGRSMGANTPCLSPRPASRRIFAKPCRAASRGLAIASLWRAEARLPSESPA